MQQELRNVWRSLRRNDDVRCIVLTGAGDKAFTTGIDRTETMGGDRPDYLRDAAAWAAEAIASQPPLAIQGTLRAIWTGLELSRTQALEQAYGYIAMGTNQDSIAQGQATFASGKRIEWRLR